MLDTGEHLAPTLTPLILQVRICKTPNWIFGKQSWDKLPIFSKNPIWGLPLTLRSKYHCFPLGFSVSQASPAWLTCGKSTPWGERSKVATDILPPVSLFAKIQSLHKRKQPPWIVDNFSFLRNIQKANPHLIHVLYHLTPIHCPTFQIFISIASWFWDAKITGFFPCPFYVTRPLSIYRINK